MYDTRSNKNFIVNILCNFFMIAINSFLEVCMNSTQNFLRCLHSSTVLRHEALGRPTRQPCGDSGFHCMEYIPLQRNIFLKERPMRCYYSFLFSTFTESVKYADIVLFSKFFQARIRRWHVARNSWWQLGAFELFIIDMSFSLST